MQNASNVKNNGEATKVPKVHDYRAPKVPPVVKGKVVEIRKRRPVTSA